MFAKSRVAASAGSAVNPLFADLARRTGKSPQWNFLKYLVGRDGSSQVDQQTRPSFVRSKDC